MATVVTSEALADIERDKANNMLDTATVANTQSYKSNILLKGKTIQSKQIE
jgi:hypothetical protein